MPQNQRLASGFAIDRAAMSSSSPGRIGVPSATMSRPAGSRMNPEDARPTQVACVTRRVRPVHRYAVEQGHDASMASRGSIFLTNVDSRAAQLAICSTSRPPPRTASPLALMPARGAEMAAALEMRDRARSCIFMAAMVCSGAIFRVRARSLVCYLI